MTVPLTHLAGRAIGVFGLARSGLATVAAAVQGGGRVVAWDDRGQAREAAVKLGAACPEPADWPWGELDSLVLSPGVPLTHPSPHPIVGQARKRAVEIVCDIELLWRETQGVARFVAITGTNGKSTTTALVGHVLTASGVSASVGGNIGTAALDLDPPGDYHVYVLEMSSYQLDLTRRFRPDVAIWLNLTPDHLDRHGDMAGYRQAKARIFANMTLDETALVGVDEPEMEAVAAELGETGRTRLRTVSVRDGTGASLQVDQGRLIDDGSAVTSFADLPTLRGAHNWQNAAMAFGAARALGLQPAEIHGAMTTFPGLAHRMEIVARRGRVVFINDSKATNADAAARALATFEPIYWVAGGQAKAGGIEPLSGLFPRVAKAYLIGEAADLFSGTLARKVPHVIAADLATAVRLAAADAADDPRPEPAVVLSPACASFDQFADFEARGRAFRAEVQALDAPTEALA